MADRIQVLTVDDGSGTGAETVEKLQRADDRLDVTPVATAEDALEHLRRQPVDCVLSDHGESGIDGLALLSEVRDRRPDVPFILYTGDGSEAVASEAISENATDYVRRDDSAAHFEALAQRIVAASETRQASEYERVADLVRDIQSDLVRARTREEVETRVCERLAEADPYVFAWIGTVDTDRDRIRPRASAGRDSDYLDEVEITVDDSATGQGPTGKAVKTRSIQVVQHIAENPAYGPWREDALERGYRSSAAVPIEYDGSFHGVLNVYSDRPAAFDADERSLLGEFAETIAHAYHRIRIQQRYESQYRELFEDAPVMMAFTRESGGEPVIEDCNRRFAETLGYAASELRNRPLAELYTDESVQRLLDEGGYERALEGEFTPQERAFVTAEGERLVTLLQATPRRSDDGEIVGTHALYVDITDRKRAREVLERAEAMEASMDGMAIIDEGNHYVYANQAHAAVYGYDDPDALIGNTWRMLYTDDEIERLESTALPALEETGEWRGEATGLRADGTTFPQELSLTSVGDGALVCVVRDITEQKERERELREVKERLELAVEGANLGIWDWDMTTDEMEFNEQWAQMLGYSLDEIEPHLDAWEKRVHPDDVDDVEAALDAHIAGETDYYDTEHRMRTADGDWKWIRDVGRIVDRDGNGEPVRAVGVHIDVTERKEYERVLERTREELRHIIDLVPDLLFLKNREGEYLLANEATAEAYGSTPEAIEGASESAVIPNLEEAEAFHEDDIEVIESGESMNVTEELTTVDGETRILETTKIPYELPESGETVVLGYGRDVTERKEYERRLEEQRDSLEVLNQAVRHDIRNDLQLVLAYADMLGAYVDADGEAYLEQILEAARDAVGITTTARDVTQVMLQADAEHRPVPLRSVLEAEIDDVRSNYEHAIVRVDGSIPDVTVCADDMLESVFRNLLSNAIQHNDKDVPEVVVSATCGDEAVAVRVADNGPGISEARRERIFEQGEMGLDSEGTGLGLYLVETLVGRYGGEVRVEDGGERDSTGGDDREGAVFVVELPIA
ncbi:PAS domain S-box protein [Natronomonas sp. LN261]|uniref:PAS domain S-box protein n=1 Tax=Natronomonas sp. LN261 TaxID=2750669 RepID=UPI0015EFBE87|nr:PAS domain S-box protein [Natronomonas sp. LN261]